MISKQRFVTFTEYASEVMPAVKTTDEGWAKTIEWADKHPWVWKIVTGTRSKTFGRGSCEYIGWAQGNPLPGAVLERVRHFHTCVDGNVRHGLLNHVGIF